MLQADLSRREQDTQVLQQKLAETEKAAQAAQAEKQQLSAQLQVSETEKRLTREQVTELRGTVGMERQEKAKLQEHAIALATNVATLGKKSGELTQEIRDNRALAPNTIFNQFLTNRITMKFDAARSGVFGRDVTKTSQPVPFFTEGSQNYALLPRGGHAADALESRHRLAPHDRGHATWQRGLLGRAPFVPGGGPARAGDSDR